MTRGWPWLFWLSPLLLPVLGCAQEYDLVITGGHVMDPDSGLDAVRNIGISGGKSRWLRPGSFPISSVDSRKRELIGNFRNAGVKRDRSPVRVNDQDFRSDASGVFLRRR
jgi:hypothetical protein